MGGSAQQSGSSGYNASISNNASGGASKSSSAPQLTPQQLINLYQTALPQFNNTASSLSQTNNPALQAANTGAAAGVNAINLNGLSPGEANAVERSTNQGNAATGNLGLNNGTNTISNAMNFGGAFNNKVGLMNQATNTATGAANANSGNLTATANLMNPLTTIGAGTTSNSTSNFSSSGSSFGAGLNNSASSGGSVNGPCCFIFMESYHGNMPSFVRKCRDVYYRKYPFIAGGYIQMARVLVPLMRRSKLVRSLVYHLMVKPLTEHGESIIYNDRSKQHKFTRKFWFTVWNIIGGHYAR